MSITVNTNMQALRIQGNLSSATDKMNTAMQRMSSGSKINSAKDDAAGLAVSTTLSKTISSSKVASDNVKVAQDMLSTAEGTLNVITSNLTRVRDLTEQAANGTYSASDKTAIAAEVTARLTQINALATGASFNGSALFTGTAGNKTVSVQSGTGATDQTAIVGATGGFIFDTITTAGYGLTNGTPTAANDLATAITSGTTAQITTFLGAGANTIDAAIANITSRQTSIGAAQNQLSAVSDGLTVQQTNLTSALSTIRDADVAQESASYVQSQILQQASASLLVQANSAPQIALTLIKG